MPPETLGLLADIQEAAQFIADETANISFEEFLHDQRTRQAVLYSFLVIGEAVNRLRRVDAGTAARISEAALIVGLRNTLIHGYSRINYPTVWRTIRDSLPVLRAETAALMGEFDSR